MEDAAGAARCAIDLAHGPMLQLGDADGPGFAGGMREEPDLLVDRRQPQEREARPVRRPARLDVQGQARVDPAQGPRGKAVDTDEAVVAAVAGERQPGPVGREAQCVGRAAQPEQPLRLRTLPRRDTVDLAVLQEDDAAAVGGGRRRVAVAELERRAALEFHGIHRLHDARRRLRGIRRRVVRILDVAAAHVQQQPLVGDEGEFADIEAVVIAVLREGPGCVATRPRRRGGEPDVAAALAIADPSKAAAVRGGDDAGCERRAEHLVDRERRPRRGGADAKQQGEGQRAMPRREMHVGLQGAGARMPPATQARYLAAPAPANDVARRMAPASCDAREAPEGRCLQGGQRSRTGACRRGERSRSCAPAGWVAVGALRMKRNSTHSHVRRIPRRPTRQPAIRTRARRVFRECARIDRSGGR